MNKNNSKYDYRSLVENRFSEENIEFELDIRDYPEETIFVVRVQPDRVKEAAAIGNKLDQELAAEGFRGFVTVRAKEIHLGRPKDGMGRGVGDPRTTEFANLLTARARTSEAQPSLTYIPDAAQNLSAAIAPRHHLVFGRRGAGKTALLVEAKRNISEKGHLSLWVNIHTHRHENAYQVFLWVFIDFCELVQTHYRKLKQSPKVLVDATSIGQKLSAELGKNSVSEEKVKHWVPHLQHLISRFLQTSQRRLYIFFDDFHYLSRKEQPILLDLIHACVRDADAWLKIAGIRHLSRWYQTNPPMGLQTGQDADHIDLDVTLQIPTDAKRFLEKVLLSYATRSGISSINRVLSDTALDRLVLASGAVPRDYLVLCSAAIRQAQAREKARLVGGQDVNKAAGENANIKIAELEDDAAAADDISTQVPYILNLVRSFCIDEKRFTYFRIDFRDKDKDPSAYVMIQSLLDLRLLHLIHRGISDEREAGRRSEVLMLDLSQFAGHRLKRHLRVLDLVSGCFVLKETGSQKPDKVGNTPNKLLGLLRRGPLLELESLDPNKQLRLDYNTA